MKGQSVGESATAGMSVQSTTTLQITGMQLELCASPYPEILRDAEILSDDLAIKA